MSLRSSVVAASRDRIRLPVIESVFVIVISVGTVLSPPEWQIAIPAVSCALILGALGARTLAVFVIAFAGVSFGFATGNDPTLLADAGGTSLDGLRLLVVLGAFLVVVLRDPRLLRGLRHAIPYIVFVGFAGLSTLWSPARGLALRSVVKLLYPVVAFLIVYRAGPGGKFAWVERLVLVAAIFGTLGHLLVRLAGLSVFEQFGDRYYGAWHPNLMGMFCVATAIPLASWGTSRKNYLYIAVAILMFSQLVLTGSRTMYLAGCAALCVVLLLEKRVKLVALFGLASAAVWILLPSLGLRSESMSQADVGLAPNALGPLQNFSGRLLLWADLFRSLVPTAGGFGHGLGATASYLQSRYLAAGNHAHNTYLEVFSDLGGVGLLLFLYAVYDLLRRGLRAAEGPISGAGNRMAFLGLGTAFVVAATMENVLAPAAEFTTFLWILYAMALAGQESVGSLGKWSRLGE